MRTLIPTFIALCAALAFATAGSAITNGMPDGNGHPEAGALLAQQAFSDGTWVECSGTLIAPRVFMTAAHCDEGVNRVEVTFASTFDRATSKTYWGTWHADPNFTKRMSDPRRHRGRRSRPRRLGHRSGQLAGGRFARESVQGPTVHAGRLRSAVGDEREGRQDVPLRRRPLRCRRHSQRHKPVVAPDLAEPVHRQRRHLLRGLGRARTSSGRAPRRRTSSPGSRSPATRRAARPMSTTGSTRPLRARFSANT